MIRIGIIGKTNTGKTTFFNAATLLNAEIANYPFTTKAPNYGIGYARTFCVCREFNVKDNPRNSACLEGFRFIPVEIVDLPGLIKGAWAGKGLGNQFLSVAAQADALLHVVDVSGSVDAEGKVCDPGTGDPVRDIEDIEEELILWMIKILEGKRGQILRLLESRRSRLKDALLTAFTGLRINEFQILSALKAAGLEERKFQEWSAEDLRSFVTTLRRIAKPTVVVANKIDLPTANENYERLIAKLSPIPVVPCSAEAELVLRRAEQKGFVKYIPGEEDFKVLDSSVLTEKQKWALEYVQQKVFSRWMRTGVQFAINVAVFKLLRMNAVYPVEDEKSLSDHDGNVLPDVFLMPQEATVADLAREIHSDLAKTLLHAIDARTGLKMPKEYVLRDRDVIKIVATSRRG